MSTNIALWTTPFSFNISRLTAKKARVVGIYSSEAEAKAAIDRLRDKPGFRDCPDWSAIESYDLDFDHWEEGFAARTRKVIPVWGCLAFILLVGALVYVAISGNWIVLPFLLGYALFFFGVAALAKPKADKTDFITR